jgi:peroxiredoxin
VQKVGKHVRMLGDGNGAFCKSLGLTQDLAHYGMGTRAQRFAMLVDNGVVKKVDVEQGGKLEVSSAEAMLKHLESA